MKQSLVRRINHFAFEPFEISPSRAARRQWLKFVKNGYYLVAIRVVIVLMVFIVTVQYSAPIAVTGVVGYVALSAIFNYARLSILRANEGAARNSPLPSWLSRLPLLRSLAASPQALFILRSVLFSLCLSLFISWFYLETDYLARNALPSLFWPLYILALLSTTERAETLQVAGVGIIAVICLNATNLVALWKLSTLGTDLRVVDFLMTCLIETLWLTVLVFVMHVLIRLTGDYLADRDVFMGLQREITALFARLPNAPDGEDFMDRLVAIIANGYRCPHVNLFELQRDQSLLCVAAYSSDGKKLVDKRFKLDPGIGILGRVVSGGATYLCPNVEADRFYFQPVDAFLDTRCELAAPVKLGERVTWILDVQSPTRSYFSDDDQQTLETLAYWLSDTAQTLRLLQSRNRLFSITNRLASGFLSLSESTAVLTQIAQAAKTDLDADMVVICVYDSARHQVVEKVYQGELRFPEDFKRTISRTGQWVDQIIRCGDDAYFQTALAPLFGEGIVERQTTPLQTFGHLVGREGIVSRAILCLNSNDERVGVMFINFRTPKEFAASERGLCRLYAALAAAAIQCAHPGSSATRAQDGALKHDLRDVVKNRTYFVNESIRALLDMKDGVKPEGQSILKGALLHLGALVEYTESLNSLWLDGQRAPYTLYEEMERIRLAMRTLYDIDLNLHFASGQTDIQLPAPWVAELKDILVEILTFIARQTHIRVADVLTQRHTGMYTIEIRFGKADLLDGMFHFEVASALHKRIRRVNGQLALSDMNTDTMLITLSMEEPVKEQKDGGRTNGSREPVA
jgi:GAF domain-containing protein